MLWQQPPLRSRAGHCPSPGHAAPGLLTGYIEYGDASIKHESIVR